jgi:hypothetical protein
VCRAIALFSRKITACAPASEASPLADLGHVHQLLGWGKFCWPNDVKRDRGSSRLPSTTGYILPIPKSRFADLWQGLLRGKDAFLAEVQVGGFVALTGVQPRRSIRLLEGATYSVNADNSITFVLSNGVVVPPLSRETYNIIRSTVPPGQQHVLDDKFFWHLQRNPAIPLIAADLGRGEHEELISNKVFDTDAYYLRPFLGHLFWAAQKADVPLQELIPLVETHLTTLEFPYLREQDLYAGAGSVHSFYKYEQELTNKQYLMRSLLTTPVEPWVRSGGDRPSRGCLHQAGLHRC